MYAIEIATPGEADVLKITLRETPIPKPGEVLIKVAAAGVNRSDILQRKGKYPPPQGASDILGLEVAGVVAALGKEVSSLKVGDAVCALVAGGGYAEYCAAPEPQCLPIPKGLTFAEASSLPEAYFTVWANVFERGRLSPGETFLMQGGSSGIGVAAIQLASAMGSRVFATAGSADKCFACEHLGAERAINYKKEDFVEIVKGLTGGRGADVILDVIGADYLTREVALLAEDGRLVMISNFGPKEAPLNLRELIARGLTVTGSMLRTRSVAFKGAIAKALKNKVWPLLESRRIKPVVYKTFPLSAAPEAQRLMESSAHIGKIILTI